MVLKEIIFNRLCLLLEGVVVLKEIIFNFSTLGGCGGLERNSFLTVNCVSH